MLDLALREQELVLVQQLDDGLVSVLHELSGERRDLLCETALLVHRVDCLDLLSPAQVLVIHSECRGNVHYAGSFLGRHEIRLGNVKGLALRLDEWQQLVILHAD